MREFAKIYVPLQVENFVYLNKQMINSKCKHRTMKKKVLLFLALLFMVAQGVRAASGSWSAEANRDLTWGSNYESASSFTISTAPSWRNSPTW